MELLSWFLNVSTGVRDALHKGMIPEASRDSIAGWLAPGNDTITLPIILCALNAKNSIIINGFDE